MIPAAAALTLWVMAAAPAELWVDPGALPGGDGSRERPLRSAREAVERARGGGRVHLAPGRHFGPLVAEGASLEGPRGAVLSCAAGEVALTVRGAGNALRGISIQGGSVGIRVEGELASSEVDVSGQSAAAVQLAPGARLRIQGGRIALALPEASGVVLQGPARLAASDVSFDGPLRVAVSARGGGELELRRVAVRGAERAVELAGGAAALEDVEVSGGSGAALFFAGARARLRRVRVVGHEYALLSRGAELDAEDLWSEGARRAGVGLDGGSAELRGLVVVRPGSFGALQVIGGRARVSRFWFHLARAQAFSSRGAEVTLEDGAITGVSAADQTEGDAIQVRMGTAAISGVAVRDAQGVCLLAAQGARVTASDLDLRGCRLAGLAAETGASLDVGASAVRAPGAPGALASEGGVVRAALLDVPPGEGAASAGCEGGSALEVWALRPARAGGELPPCARVR